MKIDLLTGNVSKKLLLFAGPMIAGNLAQQVYNIVDTIIVGKVLGESALAAVGSTYTLTTFLYSVIIGLCMGSGNLCTYYRGTKKTGDISRIVHTSFLLIALLALAMEFLSLIFSEKIIMILQTPAAIQNMTLSYVRVILAGLLFIFIYNYFANMLRSFGNSLTPMLLLIVSTMVNIVLDLLFVLVFQMGVTGAALATVIAQAIAGVGVWCYARWKEPLTAIHLSQCRLDRATVTEVLHMSVGTSIQQSVMNFGILLIQGLVNSFGVVVMAAFTVAVKIDTLAYMPAQEFGNAFSLFISQNYGAQEQERMQKGIKSAVKISFLFCIIISVVVVLFAEPLMTVFVDGSKTDIIRTGVIYLRVEGSFYCGIGLLFLLYGYFRGIKHPEISILLTIISLGTRVALAYILAPIAAIGVVGIWIAIPIGWGLADFAGIWMIKKGKRMKKETD